jgi:tetratricopeptide (TPR) repeat protein
LSARIQALPWWLQLVSCGLVVAIGAAAWMWVSAPPIPRPDLAGADPLVVLAIDDAEVRVRMTPESAAAWGDLGLVLYAQSYGQEAVECFRRATALDERTWRWPFFAAAASSHLAPADGVTLMEEAIQRDPKAVWPRLLRAEWLVTLGRGDEARADYESLLAVSPEHARARLGLARLLLASGDADGALAALGTALDHPSTRRAARQFAAQVAARQGKRDEAERLLTAAAALPADTPWPEDPLAAELPLRRVGKRSRIKLVSQMESAGAVAEADVLTRRIEEENPDIYLFVEGRLQLQKGDAAAAEKAFRRAVEYDPRAVEIRFQLGRAIALQGRHAEAADVFRELLDLEPGYGPGWLELGRCLIQSDRVTALAALESAVAYMPASDEARQELARVRRGAHQEDQAPPAVQEPPRP